MPKLKNHRFIGLLCLFFIVLASPALSEKTIGNTDRVITLSQSVKTKPKDCAVRALTEAYSNIGYELVFKITPAQRALAEANNGFTDGVTARIAGIESTYQNLVQLNTPICIATNYVVSKKELKLDSTSDFKNYSLAYILGNLAQTHFAKEYAPNTKLALVSGTVIKNMLDNERVDIAMLPSRDFQSLYTLQERNNLFVYTDYTLEVPLYHYLHISRHDTKVLLESELQKLESSGFIEKAIREHE